MGISPLDHATDYRVPVVLCNLGVLRYSSSLERRIEAGELIPPGSEEEIQIRACSVDAVEQLKEAMVALLAPQPDAGVVDSPTAACSARTSESFAATANAETVCTTRNDADGCGGSKHRADAIASGSEATTMEVAATAAASGMVDSPVAHTAPGDFGQARPLSVYLDWWLWEQGERCRGEHQHHRTLTIYY